MADGLVAGQTKAAKDIASGADEAFLCGDRQSGSNLTHDSSSSLSNHWAFWRTTRRDAGTNACHHNFLWQQQTFLKKQHPKMHIRLVVLKVRRVVSALWRCTRQ